jgi:hypothetical protein
MACGGRGSENVWIGNIFVLGLRIELSCESIARVLCAGSETGDPAMGLALSSKFGLGAKNTLSSCESILLRVSKGTIYLWEPLS